MKHWSIWLCWPKIMGEGLGLRTWYVLAITKTYSPFFSDIYFQLFLYVAAVVIPLLHHFHHLRIWISKVLVISFCNNNNNKKAHLSLFCLSQSPYLIYIFTVGFPLCIFFVMHQHFLHIHAVTCNIRGSDARKYFTSLFSRLHITRSMLHHLPTVTPRFVLIAITLYFSESFLR